jgi:hypothetical protein
MIRSIRRSVLWLAVAIALPGCAASQPQWSAAFPEFEPHSIEFTRGYYATSFDVDGDGLLDIAALSTGGSDLVWFKSPTWEQYTITTGTGGFIHMAPHDIDGDGDLDLAVASEFSLGNSQSGGLVHWAENPDDPTSNQEWTLREIDAVPTSHRLAWADLDGNGTDELVNLPVIGIGASAPEYNGASQLKAYHLPADPTDPWEIEILDDSRLEVAHGFDVVDWDGDGSDDLLTASLAGVYLFQPGIGAEPQHLGSGLEAERPNRGSSEVRLGSLGGERFIATIEPWHGTDAVIYTPGMAEGDLWNRESIGSEFNGGHGLVVADLNGDGYDEVIGGGRGDGGTLIIYRYVPDTDSWERIPLDIGGVGSSSVEVADINGDGRLDVLALGGSTSNVVWYENLGTD